MGGVDLGDVVTELRAIRALLERQLEEVAKCPHGATGLCMHCVRDFDLLGGRHG